MRRSIISRRLPFRELSNHSAVVIAPHPDDETFGTGGMIAMKRQAGLPVHVIFLTEGSASHANCCTIAPEKIGRIRHEQSIEAAACLGLESDGLVWLGLRDGEIPVEGAYAFEDAVKIISEQFDKIAPSEIYCPHPYDGLPDHEAASAIVWHAVLRTNHSFEIIYYTIWAWYNTPSPMNQFFNWNKGWALDIASILDRKADAVSCYLDSSPSPCGYPYCGRLPAALLDGFRKPTEIFFDGDADNE
ncbi:MAG: PIG-L family deacetylase [Desulfobacteraceae bacterium]|nr:PIG-L family deacetylase [Desulfobacteraceae bacterium]